MVVEGFSGPALAWSDLVWSGLGSIEEDFVVSKDYSAFTFSRLLTGLGWAGLGRAGQGEGEGGGSDEPRSSVYAPGLC